MLPYQLEGSPIIKKAMVGSRVTCDPVPEDSDIDILVLVRSIAEIQGTEDHTGSMSGQSAFVSLREGDRNYIITADPVFFEKFMLATGVAKKLNLLKKEDRVALFQAILYGKAPEDRSDPLMKAFDQALRGS